MSLTNKKNKFKLTKKETKYIVTSIDLSGFIERQEEIKKKDYCKQEGNINFIIIKF